MGFSGFFVFSADPCGYHGGRASNRETGREFDTRIQEQPMPSDADHLNPQPPDDAQDAESRSKVRWSGANDGEFVGATDGDGYQLLDPPEAWSTAPPVTRTMPVEPPPKSKPKPKTPVGDFWALMLCNLIVFCASVGIMVLELTASLLIGKHVGGSLFTWTSVIGVVLAGITVGNYLGGWLADRFAPRKTLVWLFLIAGALCFSVLWVDRFATGLQRPETLSWPYWVLSIVAMIFLAPSIALGTISPVVARIALSLGTKTGITVGNIYAWGAAGSIAGTFLAGFYLIAHYGAKSIVGMTAAGLAGMGVIVLVVNYLIPPVAESAAQDESNDVQPRRKRRSKSKSGDYWALMGYNLIVFCSSVCIMVLELTASRLIAKHVGSSLFTWTSVIGVVLAGITVGNYLGGWLADKYPPRKTLSWLFLVASMLCFSVLWMDQFANRLDRPESFSWPYWVLTVVAMVYLAPSIALGTISPVVARMALSLGTKTGITVGNIYAWGAAGSIAGTFLAGFYLIAMYGTKAIIALTAAALVLMGVAVARDNRVFRTAAVLGWLQFVLIVGLAATATHQGFWHAGLVVGSVAGFRDDQETKTKTMDEWAGYFGQLGENLHTLGLTLRLRNDAVDEYHDESHYSYINVADDFSDGDDIKYLKLDKLVHSYYNPANPTKLYYDYEQVYAAVTERAARHWQRTASVELPEFENRDQILQRLPDGVRFDAQTGKLEIRGAMNTTLRDALLELSPDAAYWQALDELRRASQAPHWGGFSSAALDELPAGTEIPEDFDGRLQFDSSLEMLSIYDEPLTREECDQLIAATVHAGYYRAVQTLFGRSRRTSTMFIGGGGFIFPRWIETYFPDQPRIDVAEVDPAVKLAVQKELGLPPDDQTAVKTFLGDARNFVDDRLQRNRELEKQGQPPVLYDFVYGDAFNDFSVPWHLTTREFSQKVRGLLRPEGVYLVNIIDIYPRASLPDEHELDEDDIPALLLREFTDDGDWESCPVPFSRLELVQTGIDIYTLSYRGPMSPAARDALLELTTPGSKFASAVRELYTRAKGQKSGRFLGTYVNTISSVFPNVYVFSSQYDGRPGDQRDTFVIIASLRPLDMNNLEIEDDHWYGPPFAWIETDPQSEAKTLHGQMEALLDLAGDIILTDDFAPVDNLLIPVFVDQG
jgi:MFS family permease